MSGNVFLVVGAPTNHIATKLIIICAQKEGDAICFLFRVPLQNTRN